MVEFLEMFVARDVFLLQTLFTSRYDDDVRCSHRFDDEEEEEGGEEEDDRGDSSRNCVVFLFATSTRKSLSPKKCGRGCEVGPANKTQACGPSVKVLK